VAEKRKSAATNKKSKGKKGLKRLVVIDGANAIFRAFFGIPGLRGPDGSPTNAVLGFTNILHKIIREESPDYIAVAMDPKGGSFRNEIYKEYKANRDATPEDLSVQFPLVKELIDAHGIQRIEIPGFEADDVIATLATHAPDDVAVSIISTDKDLMQLCTDRVELVDGIKNRRFGPAEVKEKFGVPPEQMLDLRALVGDPSDNIPGVKGIGVKGAAKLMEEWGSLDNMLAHAEEITAKRAREGLTEHADMALLSRELSTLRCDVDLGVELEELRLPEADVDSLRELYKRLGFTRLLENLEPDGDDAEPSRVDSESPVEELSIDIVRDGKALTKAFAKLSQCDELVMLAVEGAGSVVDAPVVGLALASAEGKDAAYLPLVRLSNGQTDLPLGGAEEAQLTMAEVVDTLQPLFDVPSPKPWFGWSTKRLQALLGEQGLGIPVPTFDASIGAFLLDPAGSNDLAPLAMQLLGRSVKSWEDLVGRGAKATPAAEVPVEDLAGWLADQISTVVAMRSKIQEGLDRDGLTSLFVDVELPLTRVLARIERNGVRVDETMLASLSEEYESTLATLEKEIHKLAGEEFLVSSPKQLQVILFEKLRLTPIKKTKTGYSTAKLKSTYVDALPKLISEKTGRIHPTFNQLGAATGRLSASEPNVQNIPIRTAQGVRIRETFIPASKQVMLAADYSQVELRVLAHYSGDESLVDAFLKGDDIHRRTAAEVAGISVDEVDDDQRAHAKAVNFGIIYGSSAFGLANTLGIANAEAQGIVDAYFARYTGVRRFLDETTKNAKTDGFVSTLLGRRRYLPDLSSKNRMLKQAAERMAVNSVIQGTAADLIKKAMIDVDSALTESGLGAIMIMQVHDELVFETSEKDVDALSALVRDKMEGVYPLEVPLVVDLGYGKNWRIAH
jgi:DNA polymerase-1